MIEFTSIFQQEKALIKVREKRLSSVRRLYFIVLLFVCLKSMAQERVFLHTDNEAYHLGDTLWFSATIGDALTKNLSERSRILYVELVSPEGMVLRHDRHSIVGGRGNGCVPLPRGLQSGLFELRAYTRYMLDESRSNYYSKVIPIFETVKRTSRTTTAIRHRSRTVSQDFPPQAMRGVHKDSHVLSIDYNADGLQPYGLVRLNIQGPPRQHFSLSVTDKALPQSTAKYNDIVAFVDMLEATPAADSLTTDCWLHEVGVTIHGQLVKPSRNLLHWGLLKPQDACPLAVLSEAQGTIKYGSVTTDRAGHFAIDLGNFFGSCLLGMKHNTRIGSKSAEIRIDREPTPVLRPFTAEEQLLENMADSLIDNRTAHAGWREYVSSCLHVNIAEHTGGYGIYGDGCSFALDQLVANGYPGLPTRMICLRGDYPADDTVPETDLVYDGQRINLSDYKEMVIRTDWAICSRYSFAKARHTLGDAYGLTTNVGTRIRSIGYGAGNVSNQSYGINGSNLTGTPSIVVCFVPKTELEKHTEATSRISADMYSHTVKGVEPAVAWSQTGISRLQSDTDSSHTIYWNPDVVTDADGRATVIFRNNSTCRELLFSAAGLATDGKAIVCDD